MPLNSKSTQIKPPTLVNMHFTLKPLNASPLRFQCAFRPSNSSKQTFFNSNVYFYTTNTLKLDPLQLNVPLHLQTTQNKPSSTQIKCFSTQMRLCIRNTFKWSHLQLKFAFVVPIHSNEPFFNSYVSFHLQTFPNKFYLIQMRRRELKTLKLGPLTLKCAFSLPIHSHEAL